MVTMTESQKHKAYKATAKRYLFGRGFSKDEVFEEYRVTIELTEQDREYYSQNEADERWGNHLNLGHEHLNESIEKQRDRTYRRTYKILQSPVTFVVDVVGISKDGNRKIAIECGKVRPAVRLEILREEFHEVRTIPPFSLDMLPHIKMDEFSAKG